MNLSEIRKQIKYIKGSLDPLDEEFLYNTVLKLKPNSKILEIGAYKGRSIAIMALARSDCSFYTIDIVVTEELKKNLNNIENITIIEGDSKYIKWDKQIDLLWIDGNHTYEGVKNDIQRFGGFVKDSGIICGHDFTSEMNPNQNYVGLVKAVKENIIQNQEWINFNVDRVNWYAEKNMSKKFYWNDAQRFELDWWEETHPTMEELYASTGYKQTDAFFNFQIDKEYFRGKNVLDIGCGAISVLKDVPARKLVAVDPLMHQFEKIFPFKREEHGIYMNCKGEYIPIINRTFDLIWCINTIDHCDNPKQVAFEISRTIKYGGELFLMVNIMPEPYSHHRSLTVQEVLDMFGLFTIKQKQLIYNKKYKVNQLYTILRRSND